LLLDDIKSICGAVFKKYPIDYCYLFGSYAKGKANEKSDVDLLVCIPIDGMVYFELLETLREKLHKKVDLLDVDQLENNHTLVKEILRDGIKIYGK
jgi:predicted nucleotidyltransferase